MTTDATPRPSGATFPLALLLTVLALIPAWQQGSTLGEDFYLHWCVAHSIADQAVGNIYSVEGRRKIGEASSARTQNAATTDPLKQLSVGYPEPQAVGTPFLYWAFSQLITDDYQQDYWRYRILSMLCTILALVVFTRALRFSWTGVLLSLCVLTAPFEPFLSVQRTGNVSQLQLALLAIFLLVQGGSRNFVRDLFGGVLLGIATAFKPNLGIPLLLILALRLSRRQISSAVGFGLGALGGAITAIMVSAQAFASPGSWGSWYEKIGEFLNKPPSVEQGNYAITNLFGATTSSQDDPTASSMGDATAGIFTSTAISIVLTLGILALLWVRTRGVNASARTAGDRQAVRAASRRNRNDDLLVVSLGCAITLLSAPIAWLHYYNLVMPLALYCLWPPRDDSQTGVGPRMDLRLVGGLLVTLCLLVMALTPTIQTLDADLQSPALYAQLCYWPVVVLFGLGCLQLARVPSEQSDSAPAASE